MTPDIVIIGGGIAALSTAWEAIENGFSPLVLFKKRNSSATQAAAGMLCPEIEADSAHAPLLALAKQSQSLYPDWIARLEKASNLPCGYHGHGTLLVAQHQDHMAEISQIQAHIAEQGFTCSRLTIKEIRNKEENLAPRLAGGIFVPQAHSIHPRMLYSMLFKVTEKHIQHYQNIQIHHNENAIVSISYKDNDGTEQSVSSPVYIIADGAWSQEYPCLSWLPLRPVKGQYVIVEGTPLITHTIRTPDVYMVPRANGEIYIGATMEEEGFCERLRAGHQLDLLYHSWQFIRGIYELHIKEAGVGFRPALRDYQPAIGRSHLCNLWLNIGHFRHGITIAPAASKLILHHIEKSDTTDAFSPLRFWTSS